MSLIEHLDKPGWEDTLRGTFEYSLELLETDRFRYAGSAVDDLKSWLAVGGINRVRHHLNNQMEQCRFSEEQKVLINDLLDELAQKHRLKIVTLISRGVIRAKTEEFIFHLGFTRLDVEGLLKQFSEGKSFEDVAREQGYPEEDIKWAKNIVDEWFDGKPGPETCGGIN